LLGSPVVIPTSVPLTLDDVRARAADVAMEIAPIAPEVDRDARWPRHSMEALAARGLLGIHVPQRLGGSGLGLTALVSVAETLGRACSSSAMCYAMHCVGTAVIAAKPTRDQEERYLVPIARGEHITTLSLSEAGTGVFFYLPQTELTLDGDEFIVRGTKQFVTNGSHADSYVVSTRASVQGPAGEFTCLIVDAANAGLEWAGEWRGLGMRGNSSRTLRLDGTRVPARNLLGEEGDQTWYVFEVVAPYFLMAMAGTYLGIAQAALDYAIQHVQTRRHLHDGTVLADREVVQARIADLWIDVEKTRGLVYRAAELGDLGDPHALTPLLAAKADVADTVVRVTNDAMTLCGGIAYRDNDELSRLLRDARAAHVMSPTTDLLKGWTGRSVLGLPLL
jgi:isovaleryl-CoA dehydrogenase